MIRDCVSIMSSLSALTKEFEVGECGVQIQCLTQWFCPWISYFVAWVIIVNNSKTYYSWLFFLCVLFLLSLQFRSSFLSVVLTFSAWLNDVAPVSPISFSFDMVRQWFVDGGNLYMLFDLNGWNRVSRAQCLPSMIRLMMLLLWVQHHLLLICWIEKFVNQYLVKVKSFFCAYDSN